MEKTGGKVKTLPIGEVSSEQMLSYMESLKNLPCKTSFAANPLSKKTIKKYRKAIRKGNIEII